jgi:cytochrome c-type biogenesis protein CcmE
MINKKTTVITIVMVLSLIGLVIYSMTQFATPFVPLSELDSINEGGRIQVKGSVLNGTIQWDPSGMELGFTLFEDNHSVPVVFHGEKPNGFEGDKVVVVVGKYEWGIINATEILVKCPSKYEEK